MNFVRVALDVPLPILFDYRATEITRNDVGRRVLVPFGRKIAVGVIVELTDTTALATHRIRRVLSVQRDVPPLPEDVLQLLKFCSDYYHHPLGAVILNSLPTRLRRRQAIEIAVSAHYILTTAGRNVDSATLPTRATIKRELLSLLRNANHGVDEARLRAVAPRARSVLKTMVESGWIERVTDTRVTPPAPIGALTLTSGRMLTDEQRAAITSMRGTGDGFMPWLLLGVTGSGKTEVYLQRMAEILAQGQQTLLLVPEINLTPQLEALVRARFPATHIVSLHSGLNESERLHGWLAAQSGRAGVVLGTRLAIFTPLPKLGLIVVDEEHDASFKQTDGLRYSARDLALVRAKQRAVPIVLGSATPALETFHKALNGSYRLLTLTQRVNAMPPDIEFVDTRQKPLIDGLSQELLKGHQRDHEARRAEPGVHQPPRLRARADLPELQLDRGLPSLLSEARVACDGPTFALPPLRPPGAHPRRVPAMR